MFCFKSRNGMVIDRFLEREKLVEPFLSFWWRNWYPILVSFCFPVTTWFVIGVKSTAIVFLDYLHPLSSKTGLTLLLSLWLEQNAFLSYDSQEGGKEAVSVMDSEKERKSSSLDKNCKIKTRTVCESWVSFLPLFLVCISCNVCFAFFAGSSSSLNVISCSVILDVVLVFPGVKREGKERMRKDWKWIWFRWIDFLFRETMMMIFSIFFFLSEESKCVDGTTVVIFFTSFIGLVPVASVFVASFCIIGFHQWMIFKIEERILWFRQDL